MSASFNRSSSSYFLIFPVLPSILRQGQGSLYSAHSSTISQSHNLIKPDKPVWFLHPSILSTRQTGMVSSPPSNSFQCNNAVKWDWVKPFSFFLFAANCTADISCYDLTYGSIWLPSAHCRVHCTLQYSAKNSCTRIDVFVCSQWME